ncbi:glycosyltransferase family 2 protein [Mucilaginibacter pallidiroseus]|uniref:Glycosyltransferase family 2 protein n=1 Tax=Mucilaginibacter pallidiroseus TaxID=2599295 RepID=A0A563U253_9SPHI|nr:glycosyltransferase [Mucilaginibacter pallidiroseus]TWR25181.1 glycosyltransferase family 2 protein [Mucilaginibacter pallidiroseus]
MRIDSTKVTKGVSVVICCYNSAQRLPQTLRHLALQQVPSEIDWEVIVVDNASTDNTAIIAQEEWQKFESAHLTLKIVGEPRPGKIKAFEKGVDEASYEYIVLCDDDNWLNPTYIKTAFDIMQADNNIGVLGANGQFEPEMPVNDFAVKHRKAYVNGPQPDAESQHWVYGAGSVIRRTALLQLKRLGFMMITPGRVGKKLNGGEDVELCFAIYLMGYKIKADDRLLFRHFVPLSRQNIKFINQLTYWSSYSNVLLSGYFHKLQQNPEPLKKVLRRWQQICFTNLVKFRLILLYKRFLKREVITEQDQINLANLSGHTKALFTRKTDIIEHQEHLHSLAARLKIFDYAA